MGNLSFRVAAAAVLCLYADATFAQTAPTSTSGTMDPPALLWKDPGAIAARDLFWGR